jgi:hypothetical protein
MALVLRVFLQKTIPLFLIDFFADLQVFETATVDKYFNVAKQTKTTNTK